MGHSGQNSTLHGTEMNHDHIDVAASSASAAAAYVVVKNAPPITVVGLSIAGLPLQEWVYIVTIVWILYQFAMDIRKRVKGDK
jgi:hypothetical protein